MGWCWGSWTTPRTLPNTVAAAGDTAIARNALMSRMTAAVVAFRTLCCKLVLSLNGRRRPESVGWSSAWKPWRGALNSAQIRGEPFALLHREQGLAGLLTSLSREEDYESGGPRFWALPQMRSRRSGDSRATEFSQRKLTNKWLVTVPSGVECEVRAVKRRYGQLAALVLKPSPWGSITQWCLPLRRQQAGTPASRARSMGRASPAHDRTSSKLAARRRMSRRILLHHIGL